MLFRGRQAVNNNKYILFLLFIILFDSARGIYNININLITFKKQN